jgi:hypothetical protein
MDSADWALANPVIRPVYVDSANLKLLDTLFNPAYYRGMDYQLFSTEKAWYVYNHEEAVLSFPGLFSLLKQRRQVQDDPSGISLSGCTITDQIRFETRSHGQCKPDHLCRTWHHGDIFLRGLIYEFEDMELATRDRQFVCFLFGAHLCGVIRDDVEDPLGLAFGIQSTFAGIDGGRSDSSGADRRRLGESAERSRNGCVGEGQIASDGD